MYTLIAIYVVFILWLGYQFNKAPLMDDDGNFIDEPKKKKNEQRNRKKSS